MTLQLAIYRISSLLRYLFRTCKPRTKYEDSEFRDAFISSVISGKSDLKELLKIDIIRQELSENEDEVRVTNLGASGSKNFNRKVNQILKQSVVKEKYGALLYRSIQHLKSKKILELGTSLGVSSAYMSVANPKAEIVTIEGCSEISNFARNVHRKHQIKNTQIVTASFDNVLLDELQRTNPFDFIYVDGNHSYEATCRYVDVILQYMSPNGVIVLDDINWSKGMERAWREITGKESIRLSIDLYRMGILFINPELPKENISCLF